MTQAFNLSQLANFVNTSGQLNAATGLYNQVPVANGGTGKSSVTSGALLLGAGTSAMTELTGTTPGTVVASSPTGWTAQPQASVGGGNYAINSYTSPAAWTKPGTIKAIKVTVIGAGGNSGASGTSTPTNTSGGGGGGGGGGSSILYLPAPAIAGPVTVTAGPGTNSFGPWNPASPAPTSTATATAGTSGGAGGGTSSGGAGSSGGSGSGGTFNFNGSGGAAASGTTGGGSGSSAIFNGMRFVGGALGVSPGITNTVYGGGASGAGGRPQSPSGTNPGATGAPGIVIVEEFY